MKTLIFAVALTGFASAAMAGEPVKTTPTKAPVKLTEAQMDNVTAGALVCCIRVDADVLNNALNNNNAAVFVPVNAGVAAGILGNAGAVAGQRPGAISQRQ